MSYLEKLFGHGGSHRDEQVVVVPQTQATDRQHVLDQLKYVESLGGEGLMLRKPESFVLF
jgi:DNA ligase-1